MDKYFKGKRILVTGGCQGMFYLWVTLWKYKTSNDSCSLFVTIAGIGRGLVVELWRQGANVVTLSNQPENLAKLKKEYPSIEVVSVDLRDWDKTRQVVDSLGAFDGLVNNAGIAIIEPFLECKPSSFDE